MGKANLLLKVKVFTLVNFEITNEMGRVSGAVICLKMLRINMKATSLMIWRKAMVSIHGQVVISTKVTSNKTKEKGTVRCIGSMVAPTVANGSTASNMASVRWSSRIKPQKKAFSRIISSNGNRLWLTLKAISWDQMMMIKHKYFLNTWIPRTKNKYLPNNNTWTPSIKTQVPWWSQHDLATTMIPYHRSWK